jgi:hypothetical protein
MGLAVAIDEKVVNAHEKTPCLAAGGFVVEARWGGALVKRLAPSPWL